MAVAAVGALVGVVFAVFDRTAQSQRASPVHSARSSLLAGAADSRIAFVSRSRGGGGPPGDKKLYVMNADGNGRQLLTPTASSVTPSWSPDGRKIAFLQHPRGGTFGIFEIYVMNADGSGQRRLTRSARDFAPVWSHDGTINGSGLRRLARNIAKDPAPVWSPDGRKISFASMNHGNSEICVINADGSQPRRLTQNPDWDGMPVWSPGHRK